MGVLMLKSILKLSVLNLLILVFIIMPVLLSNNPGAKAMENNHNEHKNENRLAGEKSPYLLQHAHNPVDWYPWCDEAFEKAKKENKPIFLSIGYSTCHWCHVMAHESFEDEEVARLLNDVFVAIKVDREERPDIDNIYMKVCQLMTGSGGWPLTILMTPDKKPFFAGTYIPKDNAYKRMGLMDLIPRIKELWVTEHNEILKSAGQIVISMQQEQGGRVGTNLNESILNKTYDQLYSRFDGKNGGFSIEPKFPSVQNLLFMLRYWKRAGKEVALSMVEKTLQTMRAGGIYDHVGFGFHRYATDAKWVVPHFEKMLYDQAMLAVAYVEAFQATNRKEYRDTASEIFTYVLRDMTSPEGGFYSAEDADSEGEEGTFYLWTAYEIRNVLGKKDAELIIKAFNIEESKITKKGGHEDLSGRILHLTEPLNVIATQFKMDENELRKIVDESLKKLFVEREKRIHPHKDDKILTDWNGLMIAALAQAARVFGEDKYAEAAKKAVNYILDNMRHKSTKRLLHMYRDDETSLLAYVDDYVFLIWGLLELYETTFDVTYLKTAMELNTELIDHFQDEKDGGFYFTADDSEKLLIRQKEFYDGAIPSGNSVAMLNTLRLARICADDKLEGIASGISSTFSKIVGQSPSAYAQFMVGLDYMFGPSYEIVVVGDAAADDTKNMLKAIRSHFVPNKVVLFKPDNEENPAIVKYARFVKDQKSINNKATAYICLNYSCKAPTTDINKMLELIKAK